MKDDKARAKFIVNLNQADWLPLLPGIYGRSGVSGLPSALNTHHVMGIDLLDMEPGAAFPLHTHPGAHILYVLEGEGSVTIDGQTFVTRPGDCYFIPGLLPHAVGAIQHHRLLAIGFPHKELEDPYRMDVVDAHFLDQYPMLAKIYSGNNDEERKALLKQLQQQGDLQGRVTDGI